MRKLSAVLSLAGLAALIVLVAWQGLGEVMGTLATGGWGLLWLAPYYALPLLAAALAWSWLLAPAERPAFAAMLQAEWIAHAVNGLLPSAQVGGEVVKARLVFKLGVPGPLAGASAVVDKTIQAVAQVLAALIGVALLPLVAHGASVVPAVLLMTTVLGVLIYAFWHVQRRGLFPLLARAAGRIAGAGRLDGLMESAHGMEEAIREFYGRRRAIAAACAGKFANRLLMAGEVWLALTLMDHPAGLVAVVLIETLNQAVRSAAFAVPGALGVQEGGFVVLGLITGIPLEVMLALSLAKRGRELVVGLPALLAWQLAEGKWLLIPRSSDKDP